MAASLEDRVLDFGLSVLNVEATHIQICGAEPTLYAIATTSGLLGFKSFGAGAVFESPAPGTPNGCQITSATVTDGTITTSGTAAWWATTNAVSSRLLAHGALSAPQEVAATDTFELPSFSLRQRA